ncbi:MBL fold metallo-hydrolase [Desulfocurvibacter africanus]|uniref:Beta-lactamase domain protein n=1 Tax=Desulfocurvibacter africanus subsp. africanus str. Walvis Bay TaxID=690850 RepID=F3Z360_DESAF|nr:MBL fold metallo-hydrolase [Desulfocurvibacter africanus]EGJ50304.1 beta-lactamase domain protein [Desulfocurvibacter africanus subsp. africanus str. Walvis Bay]
MRVTSFALGPLETNAYVVDNAGRALAIDPGGDPREILDFLRDEKLNLETILATHLHFDHIFGNAALAKATGAPIMASRADEFLLDTPVGGGGFMGFPKVPDFEFTPLEEGPAEFIGLACHVLATPGHTPGSLSFHFPEGRSVFVGDLLFYRSVGRTDFPGGSLEALKRSVRDKIFSLPKETVVYSGHGPETSVGDEELNNPFLSAFAD